MTASLLSLVSVPVPCAVGVCGSSALSPVFVRLCGAVLLDMLSVRGRKWAKILLFRGLKWPFFEEGRVAREGEVGHGEKVLRGAPAPHPAGGWGQACGRPPDPRVRP